MTLPYINLKTIQASTDLPGYVHRAAYLISDKGMQSNYALIEGLSPMEFQHLLLISKTLLAMSQDKSISNASNNQAVAMMVNCYHTYAQVLSCAEGMVFHNADLMVNRVFNLTRMVGYWMMQSQNLGTIIKDKYSVNAETSDKMFISLGEEPPSQKEIVTPPQPQLH